MGSVSPEGPLAALRGAVSAAKIAVAGGINLGALAMVKPLRPDLVIVGSAITSNPDPRTVVKAMRMDLEGK